MSQQIKIELIGADKGSVSIAHFAGTATASLDNVKNSAAEMGGGFEKTWAGIAAGVASTVYLFNQIRSMVEAPVKAFLDSEEALLKMGVAMKNQGDFTRDGLADLVAYAEQLQRTTAFEDDQVIAIMAKMKSYGMSNEEIKLATQAAIDMSAFTGKSIEDSAQIMGKAYLGITTGLKRVGIQIDENIPKSEIFNDVMKQVEQRFGGSAQAELSIYAGQWKQLKNQWSDIQEFLGLVFLKTLQALLVTAELNVCSFLLNV